jgi:hypothetical protein
MRVLVLAVLAMLAMLALYVYVNARGPTLQKSENGFWNYNPSGSDQLLAYRHSSRNYCPHTRLPFIFDEDTPVQSSFIRFGSQDLDTKSFGFGHYEDPRILRINDTHFVCLFVKYAYRKARMCIAVCLYNEPTKPLGTIEYMSKKNQKNWMPQMSAGALLLTARVEEPVVIYQVSDIANLCGHHEIQIQDAPLCKWRGSSQIIETPLGLFGLVHTRLKRSFKNRFMPEYKYATIVNGKIGPSISIRASNVDGFVYVSSVELLDQKVRLYCGITDCYAGYMDVPFQFQSDVVGHFVFFDSTF